MNDSSKPELFSPAAGKAGMTDLHYAAYCGDLEALKRCLAEGHDPNQRDENRGYTAVHWLTDMAATGGPRLEMLRALASAGADLKLAASNGATPMQLARDAGSSLGDSLAEELAVLGGADETAV